MQLNRQMSHSSVNRVLLWLLVASVNAVTFTCASNISCTQSECFLRLSARTGTECVSARLSLILSVPYRCGNFSSDCMATVAMPTSNAAATNITTVISGRCGNGTASMLLEWSSGRFRLRLDFQQKNFYSSQIMTSIEAYNFISRVTLRVDFRDAVFINASLVQGASPTATFATSDRTFLFASPVGMTFKCQSPESVRLFQLQPTGSKSLEQSWPVVVATFPSVRLDVFRSSAPAGGLLDGPFLCESDSNKQARSTTILVISGLLAVGMLVIVCGFLATRLNGSSTYSSMD